MDFVEIDEVGFGGVVDCFALVEINLDKLFRVIGDAVCAEDFLLSRVVSGVAGDFGFAAGTGFEIWQDADFVESLC